MANESISDRFNNANTLTKAMITAGVLIGFLVALMVAVNLSSADPPQASVTQSKNPTPPITSNVQTIVTREDAGGYTNSDLTPDTLKLIEQEMVRKSLRRGKEHLSKQGASPNDITPDMFQSSSWIMEAGGTRFGIIDMKAGEGRIKAIVSIQRNQFIRVSCIDTSGSNITTFTGQCASKIKETFGVELPSADR